MHSRRPAAPVARRDSSRWLVSCWRVRRRRPVRRTAASSRQPAGGRRFRAHARRADHGKWPCHGDSCSNALIIGSVVAAGQSQPLIDVGHAQAKSGATTAAEAARILNEAWKYPDWGFGSPWSRPCGASVLARPGTDSPATAIRVIRRTDPGLRNTEGCLRHPARLRLVVREDFAFFHIGQRVAHFVRVDGGGELR